eukprot:2162027-Pyramimonas_sp.AAC.1
MRPASESTCRAPRIAYRTQARGGEEGGSSSTQPKQEKISRISILIRCERGERPKASEQEGVRGKRASSS